MPAMLRDDGGGQSGGWRVDEMFELRRDDCRPANRIELHLPKLFAKMLGCGSLHWTECGVPVLCQRISRRFPGSRFRGSGATAFNCGAASRLNHSRKIAAF